jgi:hypothetical protein
MQHLRDDARSESEPSGEADEVEQRLAGGAGWDFSLLPVGRAECKDRKGKRHNTPATEGGSMTDLPVRRQKPAKGWLF